MGATMDKMRAMVGVMVLAEGVTPAGLPNGAMMMATVAGQARAQQWKRRRTTMFGKKIGNIQVICRPIHSACHRLHHPPQPPLNPPSINLIQHNL